jgi:hypothetical protein
MRTLTSWTGLTTVKRDLDRLFERLWDGDSPSLPADASKVTGSFKNGLLAVTMPKSPAAKGSVIPVKAE